MQKSSGETFWQTIRPTLFALGLALLLGAVFITLTGDNVFQVYKAWFIAGFSCQAINRCAFLTMLQYATPIILSGLSATVAFRVGLISIGQLGQMVVGAGLTTFVATTLSVAPWARTILALLGGMLGGALWGFLPGVLKAYLDIPEVISTLIMNPLALTAVSWLGWQRIPEPMRWPPFVPSTKLSIAFPLALLVALIIHIYLFHMTSGFKMRISGQAKHHASYAGLPARRSIVIGMMISGALAGLAGSFEVLAVHYRFVATFSSLSQFDGIIVSLLGRLHPLGVVLNAFIIGGLRLGGLNGLQLQTSVPRELGNAVIAISMLIIAIPYRHWKWGG